MSNFSQKIPSKKVEFKHFWLSVERFIGNAHLPLEVHALELHEFIGDIDSQSNPLHAVLIDTYKRCKCTHLNSVIDPFTVLDILGECLYQQKTRYDIDITLIDLIERIGLHITQKFIANTSQSKPKRKRTKTTSNTVVSLKNSNKK